MILRRIKCSVCGAEQQEEKPGQGWPGWGGLLGGSLDGENNPDLCPKHLKLMGQHLDKVKEAYRK